MNGITTAQKRRPISALAMALMVTACGGGGGGGGGLTVTAPTPSAPEIRARTTYTISDIERINSPSLAMISALENYEEGFHGDGISIGVVDSGIAAGHAEFGHRASGGGDWQGSGDGLTDPHGHGTHVASIIAAAGDGQGMLGVAPLASVVSYRVLNHAGVFGSAQGNVMIPEVFDNVGGRSLPVVNLSWSSIYEIDDLAQSVLENSLRGELAAYRSAATATGPVIVWAAGNGGDNQVSARSGLPHYFPELEDNWLTVVAVGPDGLEPTYTNRCGIAEDWCLTAPGGGDDRINDGIYAASNRGGYIRRSGTSMAAPMVSGAIAAVLDRLPGLSPRQARARLLATASHEGLETASGCTLDRCGEAAMRAVFGQGMIQLEAAMGPISPAGVVASNGDAVTLGHNAIMVPSIVGDGLSVNLDGAVAALRDDFDGVHFAIPVTAFMAMPARRPAGRPRFAIPHGPRLGTVNGSAFRSAGAGTAPAEINLPARLIDIPAASVEGWTGYLHRGEVVQARLALGSGETRHALHFLFADSRTESSWIGAGLDRSTGWLDGATSGGFAMDESQSRWVFAGHQESLGKAYLTLEGLIGHTSMQGQGHSLIEHGWMDYDAWAVTVSSSRQPEHGLRLKVDQPAALRRGSIRLVQPQLDETGLAFRARDYSLGLSQRERRISLGYGGALSRNTLLDASLSHHHNAGHQPGETDYTLGVALTIRF